MLGACLCLPAPGAGNSVAAVSPGMDDQSFFFRSWPVDDGTPVNTVLGVVRRPDGYLWVVTREGLFRFDGVRFEPLKPVSSAALKGIFTKSMVLDRRGRLWLSKDSGLIVCVDGSAARVFGDKDGLPESKAYSMAEDADGVIWISHYDASLSCIKDGKVQAVPVPSDWSGPDMAWLSSEPAGQIWFARGNNVGIVRAGRFVTLYKARQSVVGITAANRGGVFFYDEKQVWKYGEEGNLKSMGVLPPGQLRALYEDRQDRLWAAIVTEAPVSKLFYHDGSGFKLVPVSCAAVMNLSDDREGNLWVGTRGSGLLQVRFRSIDLINPKANVPLLSVQSFCEGTDGVRFAVGPFGMLARLQGSSWERMTVQLGWPGGTATCVAADLRGGVWIGTAQRGVFQWKDGRFSSAGETNVLSIHSIRSLLPGSKGGLWIGPDDYQEFYRLNNGRLKTFKVPSGSGGICAMAEDAGGDIWAATVDGILLRVKGDELTDETFSTVSVPEPIRCLHATPDGSLWIGYASRGIGWLKNGKFFLFGREQGLWDEPVFQIISDQRGWLWCAGDRGIFRISLAEMGAVAAGQSQAVHPILCGRAEGLQNLQASYRVWPGPVRSRNGELWMPMITGLAVVHPDRSIENPPPPSVVIERLTVNGRLVAAYDGNDPVRSNGPAFVDLHGIKNPLRLGPGVRQWGAEFTVVSFTGQENIRFRYRLEGLNNEWVDAGSQRVAYFSQVPPGDYRFQVIACSNEGIWSEQGTELVFSVMPFYWQTWWFLLLSWLAAAGVVGGVVWLEARRRLNRNLERLERQRSLDRERSRIARDIHDDLGSGLTRIAMLSQLADADKGSVESADDNIGVIYRTARNLTLAMDEIVWAVNPQHDTLDSLATYLGKFAQDFLRHAGIRCRLDIPVQLAAFPLTAEIRHQVFLAFKEALNNVARHSKATETCISMSLTVGGFAIKVEDNGSGLPQDMDHERITGGHGLANMRRRMEEIGGRFEIRSVPGTGTTVTFSVVTSSTSGNFGQD